jgi:hypothetical protein
MSEDQKTQQELAIEAAEKSAAEVNATRTGKGTRVKVGQTRGRNPLVISYENFDESKPETLPSDLAEFMNLTKVNDEPTIMQYVIDGYNSAMYVASSDPVSEFVEPTWSDDIKKQFRLVVRNYSNTAGVSIEDAVTLIKPGIVAAVAKAQASATK